MLLILISRIVFFKFAEISEEVMQFISDICQQGDASTKNKKCTKFGRKLNLFLGAVFATCIFWVYCASIYSIIKSSRTPIKSFDDLVKYGYNIITHEKSTVGKLESVVRLINFFR